MAQHKISGRYLEDLVKATLQGEAQDVSVQVLQEGHVKVTGTFYTDGSATEDARQFLEELIGAELEGWRVSVDGTFVSRNLPPNLVFHLRSAAQFPEAIQRVEAGMREGRPVYRVTVRHPEQFLGKKRNRLGKLAELTSGVPVEVVPLGKQESASLLNTLPKVQDWVDRFAKGVPDFQGKQIHTYKVDTNYESIFLAHSSDADPRELERLARRITQATDIAVTFERKTSRSEARSIIDQRLTGMAGIGGHQVTFQEKQGLFIVAVDAEQSLQETLNRVAKELAAQIGFRVEILIDVQRDVMITRLMRAFPQEAILTGIRNIEGNLYEVEAYMPFDVQNEKLERWSDQMEATWGARIMFSEAVMRAPDFRHLTIRGSDAETIAHRYNRPMGFSEEALALAASTATIDWEKELTRRDDIRSTAVLSIDPERTRDIDDALSVTLRPDGLFEVGVHIADVSAFVPLGTPLDQEAMMRGFTTYLVSGEIPVIPPNLSDQACSLLGDKDSLCLSVFMRLDGEGSLVDFDVRRTVIHNHARLAYARAQAILDGQDHPFAWQVRTLGTLSRAMRKARKEAGALDLSLEDDPEKPSHQLIEEFMLQANECVSRFLSERHPTGLCLFRVHPDVNEATLVALRDLAQHLRVRTPVTNQSALQKALEELLGTPRFDIFRFHVGRVLEKATYHVDQLGHGALAKEDYAHFTSPIRRYTDLIIHRLIEDALYAEERGGAASYEREDLQVIADHLNHMEIRVDAASFESHRLSDLQHYDGARRSFTGRILGLMRGRMAIKLDQTDLMVYVRYRDFKQDRLMPLSINDEITDRTWSLGDEVTVRTEGVDWSSKSINARIGR